MRQRGRVRNPPCQLQQIDWLAFLQLAVYRAARPLEAVVSIEEGAKFNKEAAQLSRVRGSCLAYLMLRLAESIRCRWQHPRALPSALDTFIPPIRTASRLETEQSMCHESLINIAAFG
jgi:hypothetical protein